MIWLGLAIVATVFFVGWRIKRHMDSRYIDMSDTTMLIMFWSMAMILFVMFLGVIIPTNLFNGHDEYVETRKIVAFADNTHINGEFFLLSGHIESEPVYSFYEQLDSKGIKQGHVDVDRALIFEDQQDTGHIEVYQTNCFEWTLWTLNTCGGERYDIHIPEGTVTRQFNLDLEN